MTNAAQTASQIINEATSLGWSVATDGNILTITKVIATNDNAAFVKADGEWYSILSLLPQTREGSDWGTNGSGVGGHAAMTTGQFTMKRSGGSKRILKALAASKGGDA